LLTPIGWAAGRCWLVDCGGGVLRALCSRGVLAL